MNMTGVFVSKQKWKGKNTNHLWFFHLTGEDNGTLSILMFPGHILYYHGFLLTHQQMHDDGNCFETWLLSESTYAKCKLLAHFIKSCQQFLKAEENNYSEDEQKLKHACIY